MFTSKVKLALRTPGLIRTPCYYGQFSLSLGIEGPHICLNSTRLIRTDTFCGPYSVRINGVDCICLVGFHYFTINASDNICKNKSNSGGSLKRGSTTEQHCTLLRRRSEGVVTLFFLMIARSLGTIAWRAKSASAWGATKLWPVETYRVTAEYWSRPFFVLVC